MDDSALPRIARAAILAVLSTATALGFHMLGGGHAPHLAGVAVPLALSFAVAIQLARVTLTRWRVAVAAAVSQVGFHFLLGLGADAGGVVVGADKGMTHHGAVQIVDGASSTTSMHHSMPLAHLAAAIATYVIIRRADVALAWIAACARALAAALSLRLSLGPAPAHVRSHRSAATTSAPSFRAARRFAPVGMRAPPLAV